MARRGQKRTAADASIDNEQLDISDQIQIVRIPEDHDPQMNIVNDGLQQPPLSEDLKSLKNYFDVKFNALEDKITTETQGVSTQLNEKLNSYTETLADDTEIKNQKLESKLKQKLKKETTITFRYKGNRNQYEFNNDLLEKVEQVKMLSEIGSVNRLSKKLDEIVNDIEKRNKMIRLADRSSEGWLTVEEYMPDELANDSDDSRKLRQAEARANKKKKMQASRKPSSTYSSAAQYQQLQQRKVTSLSFNDRFRNAPLNPGNHWNPLQPNNFGKYQHPTNICYLCGETGHWRNACPKKRILQQNKPQNQQPEQN